MYKEKMIHTIRGWLADNWKYILYTAVILMMLSGLQMVSPEVKEDRLYAYNYGYIFPWITVYKNVDFGIISLTACLLKGGYRGIEIWPQYSVFAAVVLCGIYAAALKIKRFIIVKGR